ncbi:hypothetical protein UFOVP47_97, partial [uncultured Caudovirales phage]
MSNEDGVSAPDLTMDRLTRIYIKMRDKM